MSIKRTIFFILLCLPICLLGQQNDTIALTVRVKVDPFEYPRVIPVFTIDLHNVSSHTVKVPKKTILDTSKNWLSGYILTALEEVNKTEDCNDKPYVDSSDVAPRRRSICLFGSSLDDYTMNTVPIQPMQHHLIEEAIWAYDFQRGKIYRVQFSIDTDKTGLRGKTDWRYFKIP